VGGGPQRDKSNNKEEENRNAPSVLSSKGNRQGLSPAQVALGRFDPQPAGKAELIRPSKRSGGHKNELNGPHSGWTSQAASGDKQTLTKNQHKPDTPPNTAASQTSKGGKKWGVSLRLSEILKGGASKTDDTKPGEVLIYRHP